MISRDLLEDVMLFEIFDKPENLVHNELASKDLRSYTHLPYARVHNTTDKNTDIYEFIHKGAAEVHIVNAQDKIGSIGLHKGAGASKLYGAVADLYKKHIDAGKTVRFYGFDKKSTGMYHRMFKSINRKHYNSSLQIDRKENHIGILGDTIPEVYEVTKTKHKLQLRESK